MVLCDMYKDDNSIFKNNQDRWGLSYLSKHLSYVKESHLLDSAVKLIFFWVVPFLQNILTKYIYKMYIYHTYVFEIIFSRTLPQLGAWIEIWGFQGGVSKHIFKSEV
jgi:hypothetical protein